MIRKNYLRIYANIIVIYFTLFFGVGLSISFIANYTDVFSKIIGAIIEIVSSCIGIKLVIKYVKERTYEKYRLTDKSNKLSCYTPYIYIATIVFSIIMSIVILSTVLNPIKGQVDTISVMSIICFMIIPIVGLDVALILDYKIRKELCLFENKNVIIHDENKNINNKFNIIKRDNKKYNSMVVLKDGCDEKINDIIDEDVENGFLSGNEQVFEFDVMVRFFEDGNKFGVYLINKSGSKIYIGHIHNVDTFFVRQITMFSDIKEKYAIVSPKEGVCSEEFDVTVVFDYEPEDNAIEKTKAVFREEQNQRFHQIFENELKERSEKIKKIQALNNEYSFLNKKIKPEVYEYTRSSKKYAEKFDFNKQAREEIFANFYILNINANTYRKNKDKHKEYITKFNEIIRDNSLELKSNKDYEIKTENKLCEDLKITNLSEPTMKLVVEYDKPNGGYERISKIYNFDYIFSVLEEIYRTEITEIYVGDDKNFLKKYQYSNGSPKDYLKGQYVPGLYETAEYYKLYNFNLPCEDYEVDTLTEIEKNSYKNDLCERFNSIIDEILIGEKNKLNLDFNKKNPMTYLSENDYLIIKEKIKNKTNLSYSEVMDRSIKLKDKVLIKYRYKETKKLEQFLQKNPEIKAEFDELYEIHSILEQRVKQPNFKEVDGYVNFFIHKTENLPYYILESVLNEADNLIKLKNLPTDKESENYLAQYKVERRMDINFIHYLCHKADALGYVFHNQNIGNIIKGLGREVFIPNYIPANTILCLFEQDYRFVIDEINRQYGSKFEIDDIKQFIFLNMLEPTRPYFEEDESFKKRYEAVYTKLVDENKIIPKWKSETKLLHLIKSYYSDVIYQYRDKWLGKQSLDFYIPSLNIAIEYQGKQHYEAIEFFGGSVSLQENKRRDELKKNKCIERGITLIEWKYDEEIDILTLKSKLQNK